MTQTGTVNAPNGLNIRQQASTDSPIVTKLSNAATLEILTEAQTGWISVRDPISGLSGFASAQFITIIPETGSADTTSADNTAELKPIGSGSVNVAAGLNLRQQPDSNGVLITKLANGIQLDILKDTGTGWLRVRVQPSGAIGFVSAQYVSGFSAAVPANTSTVFTLSGSSSNLAPAILTPDGYLSGDSSLMNTTLISDKLIPDQTDGSAQTVARIWNNFGGLVQQVATRINMPLGAVVAVLAAESGGRVFAADGRIVIRFEVHIFWNLWGKNNPDTFNSFFDFDRSASSNNWKGHQWRPDPASQLQPFHGHQDLEWQVLAFARRFDDTAALSSISMGAPQIMGFNYRRIGYAHVQDMFANFQRSPHAQLLALFDFVKGSDGLTALQNGDFVGFARSYNGDANADTYGSIIQNYSGLFNRLIGTAQTR